jgi:RNA polymerase sigma-70 factor (ECF subfamily)
MTNSPHSSESPRDLESTAILLKRAQGGDQGARSRLYDRYFGRLWEFAHGRLHYYQRDLKDTDDLVQVSLLRAFNRLEAFEDRREGAFLAYLRKILLNEIRQEARKAKRRKFDGPPDSRVIDPRQTPSRVAMERETIERYEKALLMLSKPQREAVVMRIEFGMTNAEIAESLGSPTANAAHMYVARALAKVARQMRALGTGRPDEQSGA